MLTERQGLPTCSKHVKVVGTDDPFRTSTQPGTLRPTRIGIDRLSRTRISQSRTMPRSNRVWRWSSLYGIATDVAPRAGFGSGTGSLIAQVGYHVKTVQAVLVGCWPGSSMISIGFG